MYFFGTWYEWWQVLICFLAFAPLIIALGYTICRLIALIDEILNL